jgi:argininosuccinate synthase
MKIVARIANSHDIHYAQTICNKIEESTKIRKTGIAKRNVESIKNNIINGNAIIAFSNNKLAGFSYIDTFQKEQFVSNSGMIVLPEFRNIGIAKLIKSEIFKLSINKFPYSKIFSITTSIKILKINICLGFKPVYFQYITLSEIFWNCCKSCANYDILIKNKITMCLCTGLLYNTIKTSNTLSKKILLAYSGGLDTSYCLKYLLCKGYEVHTAIVDTGGFNNYELNKIEEKAYIIGTKNHIVIDYKNYYYEYCIKYLIFGNVLRNNTYPLSVSSERIFQAIKIAEYSNKINAIGIAHGSTGAGNDQVRFDLAFNILCPEKKIFTPIRYLKLSRKEEINYIKTMGIPLNKYKYSINKGIWGTSIGGYAIFNYEASIINFKKKIELFFYNGEIIQVNGKINAPIQNIINIEKIASKLAIARYIHVGDTLIGIKGKIYFEANSAIIIIKAHHLLEKHVLSKWQLYWKDQLSNWYGILLHEAQYFDPIMRNIESFLIETQKRVTGTVKLHLYPYRFELIGINSSFDLMKAEEEKYGEINKVSTAEEVKGFIKILSKNMNIYYNKTMNV